MLPESPNQTPLLIFDGDCSFCRFWVERWKHRTQEAVAYAPYQEIASQFPEIPLERFRAAAHFRDADGNFSSGAEAMFRALACAPGASSRWLLWLYTHVRVFAALSEVVYRWVARRRGGLYRVTRLLWGERVELPRYWLTRAVFLRLLGAIYLIAFASWLPQISGLIGSRGILPAQSFLQEIAVRFDARGYFLVPTLAWISSADWFLQALAWAGIAAAILVMLDLATGPSLLLLWVLYLSQVSAGQDFMAFQWDALLLEAGFLAIFFAPWTPWRSGRRAPASEPASAPSDAVLWLLRWLMFRVMFSSGAVKLLSGDPTWHNLTALHYHYETQPLPNVVAWYMHQLPLGFQQFSALSMFAVELAAPFLICAPRRLRFGAVTAFAALQFLIFFTGNYTYFNLLLLVLCVPLLDDAFLLRLVPQKFRSHVNAPVEEKPRSHLGRVAVASLALIVLFTSFFRMVGMFRSELPRTAAAVMGTLAPFHAVNSYGLFAVMTTQRPEIVIEGSDDGERWLAYEFRYKPGDLAKPPRWVQPYQPRLDWQMWFAALEEARNTPWFLNLALRLLEGSPDVLRLLGENPFPNAPPRYIRAVLYDYHFTSRAERRATGHWWKRDRLGLYLPPVTLRS